MHFGLLGSVEAIDDQGLEYQVSAAKQRVILAVLLLAGGTAVSGERLIDDLWPDGPPRNAEAAVRLYVARLRRALGPGGSRITGGRPGYRLTLQENDRFDVAQAETMFAQAAREARDERPESAADLLGRALALWRGPALADVPSPSVRNRELPRLAELETAIAEARCEALLDGRHAAHPSEAISELQALITRNPLREHLHGLLMLALHRAGRTAEALDRFGDLRKVLAEELGIDPSQEIQELHRAILAKDPALAPPSHRPGPLDVGHGVMTGRNDLPADIADFRGRQEEIRILKSVVGRSRTALPICAIDGMGGVGKTTLALHAAHALADRHPDACLFLDLHGHSPDRRPLTSAEALGHLLSAVGCAARDIPADQDERAATWRAALAERRVLLVLDDAVGPQQIRPLLPGAPSCCVIVTSRRRLIGLPATRVISLGTLPPAESVELLASIAGLERVAAEPDAAADTARLCGHLPLALRIAASRLRSRPAWTVAHLARRLADERERIEELNRDVSGVAATFTTSFEELPEPARKTLVKSGLLPLLPGRTFDVQLAAAAAGQDVAATEEALEYLVDMHLVEPDTPGRYRLHELVRALVRHQVATSAARPLLRAVGGPGAEAALPPALPNHRQ